MGDKIVQKIPAKPEFIRLSKVGIYCRISSTRQEQLYSMAAQVSQLTRNVLHVPGWILQDIYLDFQSGADADRRELNRLLEDCRSGLVDTIFTKSVSRMGRNTLDLLNIIRELRSIGVRIIFEQEELDSSKYEEEFLITLLESFAQEESYNRSENIRWGLEKRKQDGTSGLYKRKCYGYTKSQDGTLTECPEEAEVVRLIFQLYLDGNSIISIIKILHEKNIPTATGKEKWCTQAIVKILTNEKYIGNVILGKTVSEEFPNKKRRKNVGQASMYLSEQVHPAIIAKETFDAVQSEMQRRSNVVIDNHGVRKRAGTRFVSRKFSSTQDENNDK